MPPSLQILRKNAHRGRESWEGMTFQKLREFEKHREQVPMGYHHLKEKKVCEEFREAA